MEVSVELMAGTAMFAFYVKLTFIRPKAELFILLLKKIPLNLKFTQQIHYHMAQNHVTE